MDGHLGLHADSGVRIADSELVCSSKEVRCGGGCFNLESKILCFARDFVVAARCASPRTWWFDFQPRYQFGRCCDIQTQQRHVSSTGLA